jgi:serine/threonine-protein kinase SRPK3
MTDISNDNIAFSCGELSTVTKKDLFKVLGTPKPVELVRRDGKPLDKALPRHLVKSAVWDWQKEDAAELRIFDFGESFQGAATLARPGSLKPPEIIFTESLDHRGDLWCVGCVVRCPTYFTKG